MLYPLQGWSAFYVLAVWRGRTWRAGLERFRRPGRAGRAGGPGFAPRPGLAFASAELDRMMGLARRMRALLVPPGTASPAPASASCASAPTQAPNTPGSGRSARAADKGRQGAGEDQPSEEGPHVGERRAPAVRGALHAAALRALPALPSVFAPGPRSPPPFAPVDEPAGTGALPPADPRAHPTFVIFLPARTECSSSARLTPAGASLASAAPA